MKSEITKRLGLIKGGGTVRWSRRKGEYDAMRQPRRRFTVLIGRSVTWDLVCRVGERAQGGVEMMRLP